MEKQKVDYLVEPKVDLTEIQMAVMLVEMLVEMRVVLWVVLKVDL